MSKEEPKREPGLIFQNQPSYTHFNKSFDDPDDALFQILNEVHPVFMKKEHLPNSIEYRVLLDPRTKKEVNQILYDYTEDRQQNVKIFRSPTSSRLNKRDHLACLRVLTAWQEHTDVNEVDIRRWRSLQAARTKEKIAFDNFLKEYSQTQKGTIYAPADRLAKLYKQLYAVKLKKLLTEYPDNLALNTHAGLPLPQSQKASWSKGMQIENVRLVKRQGWVPIVKEYAADFQRLNVRLENYLNYYVSSIELEKESKWYENLKTEQKMHHYYIPLESLIFLLTAGNSPDLPTEVPLEIEDSESGFKVFKFEEPLPPRNCGWYTHKFVVENAFEALISASEDTQWLYMANNIVKLQETVRVAEIEAAKEEKSDFQVYDFKEYLQKFPTKPEKSNKTNSAVIEWNLSGKDDEQSKTQLQLYTRLKLPPAKDVSGTQLLSSYALKLEYKPHFGAEIMTKYELIKEWFQLKFLTQCDGFYDHGLCIRIAVNDFSVQLEHNLMLASIELQLNELYQVKMPQLLAGLAVTLQLLANMAKGKYFLRFNPRYSDKLLLSAPSTEITPNTVFLHALLKIEPSDLLFMTNVQHLPISDLLCTVVHKKYKVMPCAFKSFLPKQNNQMKIKSDEEFVNKRIKAKLALKLQQDEDYKRRKRIRKRKVRAHRVQQRKKHEQVEMDKEKELESLINEC